MRHAEVIYPEWMDEAAEMEVEHKAWLNGAVVALPDGERYAVSFGHPVVVKTAMTAAARGGRPTFLAQAPLVLVRATVREVIEAAADELAQGGFFDACAPLGSADTEARARLVRVRCPHDIEAQGRAHFAGSLSPVFAEMDDGTAYELVVMDACRILRDAYTAFEQGRPVWAVPGLVVAHDAGLKEASEACRSLSENMPFFRNLRPLHAAQEA